MKRNFVIWILVIILGLVLACGPISKGLSPSPTGSNSSSTESIATGGATSQEISLIPDPLTVQVTLDTANAQTGIAPNELIVQTNSTQYVLLVPEIMVSEDVDGTLLPAYGTPVTMTPVDAIEDLPFSQGFLAAVQLAPHGLFMLEPAMLMLTIPGEFAPGELVGFAWDGSGDNFHLYPANILSSGGGQTIVLFDIMHIGGDGVGVAPATPQEVKDQHARIPEGEINQNDDLLSPLTPLKFAELERQQIKIANELLKILSDQLQNGITRGNCNDIDVLSQKFITWHARVLQVEGGADHFNNSINAAVTGLRPALEACLTATCSICMGTPPISKQSVDSFLIHAFYAEKIANIAGDSSEAARWFDLSNMCAENAKRPLPHPQVASCGPAGTPGCGASTVPPTCPGP